VKKAKKILLALAGCIAVLLANRAAASSGSFQAFGYVRTAAGDPVANIDVTGDDYVGDFYTFKSDATGYYSVDFDSDGNYRVSVNCQQLAARGFACANPVAISIADGAINVDFTVQPMPLTVTNTTLPRGNVGMTYNARLGAVGGQNPYNWQLAADSGPLPGGLSLASDGHLTGVPEVKNSSSIKVQVTDGNSGTTNKTFLLTVNPQPVLTPMQWATNRFFMTLSGGSNQNYTLQMSTNLSSTNWISLFVTSNRTANSFLITDTNATNMQRTYRVLVGP
jgi:hypothetical protein